MCYYINNFEMWQKESIRKKILNTTMYFLRMIVMVRNLLLESSTALLSVWVKEVVDTKQQSDGSNRTRITTSWLWFCHTVLHWVQPIRWPEKRRKRITRRRMFFSSSHRSLLSLRFDSKTWHWFVCWKWHFVWKSSDGDAYQTLG